MERPVRLQRCANVWSFNWRSDDEQRAVAGHAETGACLQCGPCPPEGDHPHRYLFTVFAVKTDKLDVKADTSAAIVGFNLHFNTLARAEIMGLFKR
jgi:Raf kinase inhibitor-like YbhB/YbcL family protein